ncbi:unannotated protein [freshwater metagenome]|uniref:Unannotated protein n=1 Tax=freshwater metagenome TaxID=449393 RepID=A0A6J6UFE3_9ZZZZ|nr:hypothetical protein [Actinomycetota bacterium]MSV71280.1 hypothetical protein [Actinomycetota bacterium]MSZ73595.1 hypothetical protein [Actinomycetota bacterium]MTA54930.1 hypothetical protein [Actinomycetota bacterium]
MRQSSITTLLSYLGRTKTGKIRIFLLRGGLGNQLFQIAGMASLSKSKNFYVVFCETDVKKNPRDKQGAAALSFDVESWFSEQNSVCKSNKIMDFLIRVLRSEKVRKFSLKNINADLAIKYSEITIATIQGYLQSAKFPMAISADIIKETFHQETDELINPESVAIHIRAQDGLQNSAMVLGLSYYRDGLMHVGANSESSIDVFSDDILYAQSFCAQLGNFSFNFPEIDLELSPTDLLLKLASYNKIISSKSTLCWWSTYIAQTRNPGAVIISPWESDLHLENWIRLKNV